MSHGNKIFNINNTTHNFINQVRTNHVLVLVVDTELTTSSKSPSDLLYRNPQKWGRDFPPSKSFVFPCNQIVSVLTTCGCLSAENKKVGGPILLTQSSLTPCHLETV